jgi:2',3'-cyclic-nucleotide 2'-phosphodiesterase (5'-nucleotidase family)
VPRAPRIWRNLAFLALGVLVATPAAFAGGGSEQTLTILYTASLNGNLDGCECKTGPKGGLVKRAAYLRQREAESSVLVDTGDILDVTPDEELARHVYEVYAELAYDAIAVGDQELSNGFPSFLEAARKRPLLCNNLVISYGGSETRVSPDPMVVTKGELRVGIGSLIDERVFALYPADIKNTAQVLPEEQAAREVLAAMESAEVDVRLLLYHGSVENALALSKSIQGFDVIIVGHEQRLVDAQRSGSAIIASPGEDGNRLGELNLTLGSEGISGFTNSFRFFDYASDPDDPGVRERINDYKEFLRARARSRS